MRYPAITPLASQRANWNELALDYQLAALEVWESAGRLANIVFCLGA